MTGHTTQMMRELFMEAPTFLDYLREVVEHRELWNALYRRFELPGDLRAEVEQIRRRWHLLALTEDWCLDGVNTLPIFARVAESAADMDLRVLDRDGHPELMNRHLTDGSRSIPVVMFLDEDFRERGWWGPRPAPLQRWVIDEGLALPSRERYQEIRRWYARDKGRTTVRELLQHLSVPV